ncbi:polyhydroxybutyrate depolymerase [Acuticoccus sediminis]|uniref:Polyhydroxybutyrate depolymerase n=1 Tax=Acuticoccus sediminis TaxID=2184697 RepID=A0A8B2NX94_9HYPH|nr:polyhydroxybutyrate depolymerase [Acuticoccus sediminis]RAI03461.1 polyhydroxybutyrate depolymerase [Acuticoccus sediminis]
MFNRLFAPLVLTMLLSVFADAGPALACGADSDCTVSGRTYRIALPKGEGPFPAILYFHGYGGSAEGVMDFTALRETADRLGAALIAMDSAGKGWLIRNAPRRGLEDSDIELDAVDAVLADVTKRFEIDPKRIMAAGFSGGAMMTWTLACRRGADFVGFVPIAGTFWAPIPTDCDNPPVDILHFHGTSDTVVPLAGRAIGDTRQGNVEEAVAAFRKAAHHGAPETVDAPEGLALTCDGSSGDDGTRIIVCLHDGGHEVRPGWIAWGWHLFMDD